MLKITARLITDSLQKRGVEFEIVAETIGLVRYRHGDGSWHIIKSCLSDKIPATAAAIADDKVASDLVARVCGLPMLPTCTSTDMAEIKAFIAEHKPVVVKPRDAGHGNGITIGITTADQLQPAIERSKKFSAHTLVQKQAPGNDCRIFVIDYTMAAAARRIPASVTGDGTSTYRQLIEQENKNPLRGSGYTSPLNYINEDVARVYLGDAYETGVPAAGQTVQAVGVSNIGAGGKAEDITDTVSPAIVEDAIKLAKYLEMPVCAIDFMYDATTQSHFFLELNANPSFVTHEFPHIGQPQPIAERYVDWLLQ